MRDTTKVSIVSISYNQEKYIRRTLEGFVRQKTNFRFEIIIGDDSSKDNTPRIIQEYTKKYPNMFKPILRKQNIGPQKNLYDVLRKSKAKYLAICEGDDYWTDSNKLQKQVDYLDSHIDCSLCFHPVKVEFENTKKNHIFPDETLDNFTLAELLKNNFIQTNSVMYRRQEYDNLPENILPLDWYLHLYHANNGKIGFIDNVMSVYRRHPGGIWWNSVNNIDEIWKKYSVEHIQLFTELLKLFGDSPNYRKIIYEHIGSAINDINRIDEEQNTHLVEKVVESIPSQDGLFLNAQYQVFQNLKALCDKKASEVHKVNITLLMKDRELKETREQLRLIQSSRVWKARNRVKKSLNKTSFLKKNRI
ncbi:MAG TPA: glycosyltransferase [Candidatus Saccharibacteria bacterium]|nr:glycosyltransferase [Candidatus Saccharibacteria bacterium]